MKILFTIVLLLLATYSATAQGTVLFQNYPDMSLVRLPDGRPIPAGNSWRAELLAGADAGSLASARTTAFKLPGVFGLGDPPVVLPGLPTDYQPFFQVRFWETQNGTITDYNQAQAAGVRHGVLAVFQLLVGLGGADGDPPAPPLAGFTTFDAGGWIYVDRVEDDVVINWGRQSTLLGILHHELAEAPNPEGPWTVIGDAEVPYVAPGVQATHKFFRTIPVYPELANQTLLTRPSLDVSYDP